MMGVCCLLPLLFALASAGSLCPGNWIHFGDRCILLYPVWATWDTAKTLCFQSDSHLISLRSHDDVEFVSEMVVKLGAPVWTGGNSVDQSGSWLWSDGSDFTLRSLTNHTSGKNTSGVRCLGIESEDGKVKSSPCDEMRFYICSRKMREEPVDPAAAHSGDNEVNWFSGTGPAPGVSLAGLIWAHSESVAEEILQSSSFLRQLQSGSITTRCYDLFRQQEALYMGLLYRTLEELYIQDTDPEVRTLLLDEKQRYKSKYSKQDRVTAPLWLQFALQPFHSLVEDDPVYLLVALSARSILNSYVFESLPLLGHMLNSEANSLYQRWREDTEQELLRAHRFKDVIERLQNNMDVYKSINVFRIHLMNQKGLHKYVECGNEEALHIFSS